MKQHEEVISVMEANGGYSTLGQLYTKVDTRNWKTKTPFATIRRIVQDNRYFFKIKPGLWALNAYRDKVYRAFSIDESTSSEQKDEFNHTYYQGLLVEIGNLEGFKTIVPNQDKNKRYLTKPLKDYLTANEFYAFTFDPIIKKVKTVDVAWFNSRKFPNSVFEIEHTTDINTSLLKFLYLQDFNTRFNIVADKRRESEFQSKYTSVAFEQIRGKVRFLSYEDISDYHSRLFEVSVLKQRFYI